MEGKKIKRETKVQTGTKPEVKVEVKPAKNEELQNQALEVMEIGVLYTSTQLADKLGLTGEARRDKVRHLMSKLAADKKVNIVEPKEKGRSKFLYELAEK